MGMARTNKMNAKPRKLTPNPGRTTIAKTTTITPVTKALTTR
jgi:hypothetical protein